ncbi:ribonuclease M5 [Tepidibacillus fermentans]|uniref:Ribonuclease M5 n=1 Tax=Tepidibacillus fermentans TaxID=1281767 RepID=A0A4R3KAP3_9BACI|nr:ribonuclease M5 [Tepidibacillus fermentans]TCS80174.1 ribonuclease M5 [Tepidibacillus fermentans]
MKIKEVIVVEGRDDTIAIQRAVEADTIETGGSALSMETIRRIEKAQWLRGVIVFTDPDYPGEKIRKTISQKVPGVKHAFLAREEATKNGNIGVENATPEAIIKALNEAKTEWLDDDKEYVSWERLIEEGLVGGEEAKKKRLLLGKRLGIGYGNAKQFHKRLKMFQITEDEFNKAIKYLYKRKDE